MQEATAASALNHPRIVTIYDIGSADGVEFIAMELVQGRTLDRIIARPGLPLAAALSYAIQIADALAKAHAAGIVHRDIKPSNIMVTDDGGVEVLDFGIAKLTAADETPSPVDSTRAATTDGRVIATIAHGQRLDSRSDVFSFGAVLYEMVTAVRASGGDDSLSTLTTLLAADPRPPCELSAATPGELERIILHLRTDTARRFQVMSDLVVELEEVPTATGTAARKAGVGVAPRTIAIGAAFAVAALTAGGWWLATPPALPPPMIGNFTSTPGDARSASPSPDGSQLAFAWSGVNEDNIDIDMETSGAEAALRLATAPSEDSVPSWSPGGSRMAFVRRQSGRAAVYLTPPAPGAERKLVEASATSG